MANKLVKKMRLAAGRRSAAAMWREGMRRLEEARRQLVNGPLRVAFVVQEAAMWKSEPLFKAMLADTRFAPVAVPALSLEEPPTRAAEKLTAMREYILRRGYPMLDTPKLTDTGAQIVFYTKPYDTVYSPTLGWQAAEKMGAAICYIPYGYNITLNSWLFNQQPLLRAAMIFVENTTVASDIASASMICPRAFRATGLPSMPVDGASPWKPDSRKRIIWAPHFSYRKGVSVLNMSSFASMAWPMLSLAQEMADSVQIAFKPHPLLLSALTADPEWGAAKAEAYYRQWAEGENTLLAADGDYQPLFRDSDALIHDSGSFTVEYLAHNKPALATFRELPKNMSRQCAAALDAYTVARGGDMNAVRAFIDDVAEGRDPMADARRKFCDNYLRSSANACKSIIDNLLGIDKA